MAGLPALAKPGPIAALPGPHGTRQQRWVLSWAVSPHVGLCHHGKWLFGAQLLEPSLGGDGDGDGTVLHSPARQVQLPTQRLQLNKQRVV